MGSAFSKQKVKILVVGLDNSGKTTILTRLRQQNNASLHQIAPTVGFNQENFEKFNLNFNFIDMSGQNQYRDMWEQYSKQIDGMIFVIDSSDQIRHSVMANELELLLNSEELKNHPIPILFYANKNDQKDAQDPKFFVQYLKLEQIQDRSWYIVGSNGLTGEGLDHGLQWLSHKLQAIKKK